MDLPIEYCKENPVPFEKYTNVDGMLWHTSGINGYNIFEFHIGTWYVNTFGIFQYTETDRKQYMYEYNNLLKSSLYKLMGIWEADNY